MASVYTSGDTTVFVEDNVKIKLFINQNHFRLHRFKDNESNGFVNIPFGMAPAIAEALMVGYKIDIK